MKGTRLSVNFVLAFVEHYLHLILEKSFHMESPVAQDKQVLKVKNWPEL